MWLFVSNSTRRSEGRLVAETDVWTLSREWRKIPQTQLSERVFLRANRLVFVEADQWEDGAADHMAVGYGSSISNPLTKHSVVATF